MSYPRRSARLSPHVNQQQQQQQHQLQQQNLQGSAQGFAHFSQPSSTSTTSFPSPSNDSSNPPPPPPTPAQARLQVHTAFTSSNQQGATYAPLPSPSVDPMGQGAFFNQGHPQQGQGQQQQYLTQEQQQQRTTSPSNHGHQQGHHNSLSQPHPPNIQNANPGQLPPDFLAEAAKRAQMACLMRDLGDVSL